MALFSTRPWRMRSSLAVLAGACLLPGALVSAYFTVAEYRQQRSHITRNAIASARGIAATLDRDLASIESGLRVLAASPPLIAEDLPTFYQQASEALPYQNITNYVLIDALGRQRLNTLKPWGRPLPTVGSPAQLQRIFDTDDMVLTDLFTGPVTKAPILAMGVPVRLNGKVIYSLNAGILPERISKLVQLHHLPKNWISAVLDGQGKLVARSHEPARFVGKSAVPALVNMAHLYPEGTLETVTLEGIPVITAFSRSNVSNWTAVVGIPRAELMGDLQRSLALLIGINVLLFSSAWWLAWRLALSHVVSPTDRLLQRMRQISHDEDSAPSGATLGSLELQALDDGLEEMRLRLRLRDQERQSVIERLSTTLESISDGFYMLDRQWCFTHVNHHTEALLRRDRSQLVGRCHQDVFDLAEAQPMQEAYEQAMRTHQATSFDIQLPSLGAWLEINAYPSDLGLAVYFRDITELRQARAAQAAQIAAEAASQAKNEFLSRMSHELRTPLNAVLGFAQVLRLDTVDPLSERHGLMVERIESAGLHLLAMISDVLDLSRVEAGAMPLVLADVDVRHLADECCQMIDAQARATDLAVEVDIGPGLGLIQADPTRLKQVLLNLLSNAVKYNRPGGHVGLSIHLEGELVRFKVRDTGPGLSPEQLQALFEPFNRLGREQSSTPGTGIGLVISRKLVALMGGQLEVRSVEGEGCEFFFALPRSPL